jgi:hypothetical protein
MRFFVHHFSIALIRHHFDGIFNSYAHTNPLDQYYISTNSQPNRGSHKLAKRSESPSRKARYHDLSRRANGGHILGLNPTCIYANKQWEIVSKV